MTFDELHKLLSAVYLDAVAENKPRKDIEKAVDDWFFEMMVDAYLAGFYDVNLGFHPEPDLDHADEVVYAHYGEDEKNFMQRVADHIREGDLSRLLILADSEYHRMVETGSYDAAVTVQHLLNQGLRPATGSQGTPSAPANRPASKGSPKGTVYKTWQDMGDEKVRDTHIYLNGMTVPLDEYFYSISGDYGKFPGGFKTAKENAGCRCHLSYSIVYSGDEGGRKAAQ